MKLQAQPRTESLLLGPASQSLVLPSPEDLPVFRSVPFRGAPSSAAHWRGVAEAAARRRDWDNASAAYREASGHYGRRGDVNSAKVMQILAQRYETRVNAFLQRPPSNGTPKGLRRLEPAHGCYIGAFVDREDRLTGKFLGYNGQHHRDFGEFGRRIGRRHATCFTYTRYGNPFPAAWFAHLRENGAAAQWVLQPEDLRDVQDDDYLRGLARDVAASGVPVFLRFAGEMNGDWVPYHEDPEHYKDAFRLVARVFHQRCPNVAMVWCPNEIPEPRIPLYYPGEAAVDWVGVNFYSVYFNNNNRERPIWWRNPSDCLETIYGWYADKHPILIGEYAATHRSSADNVNRSEFAQDKIAQLFSALPRRWPRVKAVHWFSMNAIEWASPGRRLNNYSVLGDSGVAAAYSRMIRNPYFLDRVATGVSAPVAYAPLRDGSVVQGVVPVSAEVKAYEQRPRVAYSVNGTTLHVDNQPGEYAFAWDTRRLPNGPAILRIDVFDRSGKRLAVRNHRLVVANGKRPPEVASGTPAAPAKPAAIASNTKASPSPLPQRPQAVPGAKVPSPTAKKAAPDSADNGSVQGIGNAWEEMGRPTQTPSKAGQGASNLGRRFAEAVAGGLELRIDPGNRITYGEGVRFTLVGRQAGFPVLLLFAPDSPVRLLSSAGGGEQRLLPGERFSVPASEGRVLRPDATGTYRIVAVLCADRDDARVLRDAVRGGVPPGRWGAIAVSGAPMWKTEQVLEVA